MAASAYLGRSQYHREAFHTETNRNGKHSNNFLTKNNLHCLNTRFEKSKGKLWTQTYPIVMKTQLDCILVSKKWINSMHNCETYN